MTCNLPPDFSFEYRTSFWSELTAIDHLCLSPVTSVVLNDTPRLPHDNGSPKTPYRLYLMLQNSPKIALAVLASAAMAAPHPNGPFFRKTTLKQALQALGSNTKC